MHMRPNVCKHLLAGLIGQPSTFFLSVLDLLFKRTERSKLKFQLVLKTRIVQVNQTEIQKSLQHVICCVLVVEILVKRLWDYGFAVYDYHIHYIIHIFDHIWDCANTV